MTSSVDSATHCERDDIGKNCGIEITPEMSKDRSGREKVCLSAESDEILGMAILDAMERASPKAWIERDPEDTAWDNITIDGRFCFGEVARQLRSILKSSRQVT